MADSDLLSNKPLCFVLMPFGKKQAAGGMMIDFNAVYADLIAPAIADAGLEPIRADEEQTGGLIHKPMFERLILCESAVADLTNANANVFYKLGVRHAVRPATTVLLFAEGTGQLPFDVAPLRALPYKLAADGTPADTAAVRQGLAERLRAARDPAADSPVYQMVDGFPDIQHLKTDVFRDRVRYSEQIKAELATARDQGLPAVRAVQAKLGSVEDADAGVVVDLYLSYRDVKGWQDMIDLVPRMSRPLAMSVLVQEQFALALNRAGRSDEAERTLLALLERRGPSSETYGLLGRVYKDRWEADLTSGRTLAARGILDKAIDAYLKGYNADMRDAYPGINAATLMELRDPPDPRRLELLPAVSYAVKLQLAAGKPNYWDYATSLEIAVLRKDESDAMTAAASALATQPKGWMLETTGRNLKLIQAARERRGEPLPWTAQIEQELAQASRAPGG